MKILTGATKAKGPRPTLPPKPASKHARPRDPAPRQKSRNPPDDPLFRALREELGL